jgi:phosphatidylserine decarboxylase
VGIRAPDGTRIAIRQVTGALARRIVCPLVPGQRVARGERVGMIKLGSRTELLVPQDVAFEARVKVGDRVLGGATVLGVLSRKAQGAHVSGSEEVRA